MMHRLLARQLRKLGRIADPESDPLLALIDAAYHEFDAERARHERANQVLSDEVMALTKRVRAEAEARVRAELRETVVRAEAESRAKSAFLASMSHELRTPMNGVLGMTNLLLDSDLSPPQRACAEAIRDSGNGMLALINDILDLSKIESGKVELEDGGFSPGGVVESVVELLAAPAHAKGVVIGSVVRGTVPTFTRGDAGRVRQVLMNLVGNAVKFTERGQVVVEIDTHDGDGRPWIRFRVRDSGIGIPPDVLPRLFGEFVQADSSTTRRFGGTGLGLAISKRLTNMMDGRIEVESAQGVGSTFTVELPRWPLPDDWSDPDAPPDVVVPPGLRVLVADSNPGSRALLAEQLREWGAVVETVHDGEGALLALREATSRGAPWDFVLFDNHVAPLGAGSVLSAMASLGLRTKTLVIAASIRGDMFPVAPDALFMRPIRQSLLREALGAAGSPRPAHGREPAPPSAARRVRVLLVEDNAINQRVAVGMLERAGHRVDVAASGREALDALDRLRYDLVLMDVQMPDMDGLEATRRVRRHVDPAVATMPIVGLTANAMPTDRQTCLDAGMDDFLTKPVDRAKLLEKVQRWARRRTSKSSLPWSEDLVHTVPGG
jgi:signal transduction histidine kinase/CheY-like chemotaxis protein